MGTLTGQVAVITGSSGDIGRAIALKLATEGATLCLMGLNLQKYQKIAQLVDTPVHIYQTDLSVPHELESLVARLQSDLERIDILVHCAGLYANQPFALAPVEDLDKLYAINVRAPFRLTQGLLPALIKNQGQVVFINSMAVLRAAPRVAHYAATKNALRALADSLREEVNQEGVRVISIYPGRTAGAIQKKLFQLEGRPYKPKRLLQPAEIANTLFYSICQPRTAEITDIFIRPFHKP